MFYQIYLYLPDYQVFTLDYADSGNYNSTFRLIGKVGLVHLTLLVISNLVSKWKDSKAIQGPTNSVSISFPDTHGCYPNQK